MASGSPKNTCNWLLVEWKSGGRDVVLIEAVLSPLDKELIIDDMIVVNRLGEPEEAKLVARARARVRLDAMIRKSLRKASPPTAGPSVKREREEEEEEPEDFCSSASSWVPSDDDGTLSDDTDEIPEKKITKCKRQYSNKRTSKKIITPSHKATPIIPKSMQKPTKMMNRIKSWNTSATKTKEIFKALFKSILEMKQILLKSATGNQNFKPESLDQAPPAPKPYNETVRIFNQTEQAAFRKTVEDVREGEEINSDHTKLKRSGDNVLIPNNFTNAAIKTVQNKVPEDSEWVPIGSGKTLVNKEKFNKVKWTSYTIATRSLLLAVFSRRVLATHSLTGKKSPAFQNKPAKMCLDPKITTDIIYEVMDRFNVKENLVRSIITTKCADECKMWKNRHKKKKNAE